MNSLIIGYIICSFITFMVVACIIVGGRSDE